MTILEFFLSFYLREERKHTNYEITEKTPMLINYVFLIFSSIVPLYSKGKYEQSYISISLTPKKKDMPTIIIMSHAELQMKKISHTPKLDETL